MLSLKVTELESWNPATVAESRSYRASIPVSIVSRLGTGPRSSADVAAESSGGKIRQFTESDPEHGGRVIGVSERPDNYPNGEMDHVSTSTLKTLDPAP